jgi:hypothetical protein
VDRADQRGCWNWQAGKFPKGYGSFWINGRDRGAHIVAWELVNSRPVPKGFKVCHTCDNPPCCHADVNPEISHLFLGTTADNAADMARKGRSLQGIRHHKAKLTNEQVAEIRALYVPRIVSQRFLAKKYGVTSTQIANITNGSQWRHI